MEMNVINEKGAKVVLLIHPMLSSAEGMKMVIADNMKGDYRFLIPDLASHGSAREQTYKSARQEADDIHEYLKTNGIPIVDLVVAASLGVVVFFELLEHKDIRIKRGFADGGSFHTSSPLNEFIFRTLFLLKHNKALKNRNLAIEKMSALYGPEAGEIMADNFIHMNKESIVNIVHDCSYVHLPSMSKELQKHVVFSYGSKDGGLKIAKKQIPKLYPNARLKIWEGYGHCEKMTRDTLGFCKQLEEMMD